MRKIGIVLALVALAFTSFSWGQNGGSPNYKPKRINKMIELLEAGQPVYDVGVTDGGFEEGKKLAQTYNDVIMYEMEHGPFDPGRLRQFMLGLVEGGPTKTGHRTPTVIVTLPILGLDGASVLANHWVIEQVLGTGVHGLMLCHARTPEAVKMFVAGCRYPFERPGVKDSALLEGLRGSGSQGFAAKIWGISSTDYLERADPWPLNPKGELVLSVKIEDKHGLANCEKIAAVPGLAWGEWGPGDQAMSLMGLSYLQRGGSEEAHGQGAPTGVVSGLPALPEPVLQAARTRIFAALKANHVAILHSSRVDNIEELIKAGIMVTHGTNEELTTKGRRFTKREMPY
jgi:4-hydroxy-2-oxoheptanedioate aldolase